MELDGLGSISNKGLEVIDFLRGACICINSIGARSNSHLSDVVKHAA